MISKQNVSTIMHIILVHVGRARALSFIADLEKVPGNKSYQDSIRELRRQTIAYFKKIDDAVAAERARPNATNKRKRL